METYSWPCVSDLASPAVGEICRAWDLWGQGVVHGSMASAAFFRPQDGMQESIVLHVVALRFWVRPCPFERGGGKVWEGRGGLGGEIWSRLGQGYDRVFSHLSKPRK